MWGRHVNLSFTDEKTGMQRNSYPAQGPMTIKCQSQEQNLSLPDSKAHGPSAKTWYRIKPQDRMSTMMLSCCNFRKRPHASTLWEILQRGTAIWQTWCLGNLNYCVTGAWVAGARTQGGTEIGVSANYRSSRQKNVLSECKEWKTLQYPKQSTKRLTQ